jgi:pimeloyl-ACP methyl ester carboxylesterase
MKRLISVAAIITLAATAGCAHMEGGGSDPVVMAEAMVPSDPGVSVYVRNKRLGSMTTFTAEKTVLFVHGATVPSGIAFDLSLGGESWMNYIAKAGYDVWFVDVRGYGRSTRPAAMDQPPQANPPFATTEEAVRDVSAAVDYILQARSVPRLNLIGWSWGTVTMAWYTSRNNAKVDKLVLYAPIWIRQTPSQIQAGPGPLGAYRTVAMSAARERWLAGVAPEKQKDLIPPGWFEAYADATLKSDPGGMARNPPVLRAPNGVLADGQRYWAAPGGQAKMPYSAADIRVPTLLIKAEWDLDTPAYMAQTLFPLLTGTPYKRYVELGEGTHFVVMEKNRMSLFREVQLFLDERYAPAK